MDHATGIWIHWVLYNIPPDVAWLAEGVSSSTDVLPDGTTQGTNDYKTIGYNGPCPPPPTITYRAGYWSKLPGDPHRYYFRLYALDAQIGLASGATKAELVSAIEGHVLAQADTRGKYQRSLALEACKENKGETSTQGLTYDFRKDVFCRDEAR